MEKTKLTFFWYWLARLIDGDGNLRSNKSGTEIVLTMGYEDFSLLVWLRQCFTYENFVGPKLVAVKNKRAHGLIFLQGNCDF